jgi:uncharacterized protein (DUF169 family)
MMNLKEINEGIVRQIRPSTFPVAIRVCQSADELPEGVMIPSRDLGREILTCQTFTLARRMNATVAIAKEDQHCPFGQIALGFAPATDRFLDGEFTTGYLPTNDSASKAAETMPKLEYGKYSHLLVGPLEKAEFEPHIILVYGDPAQIMKLIQGALRGTGKAMTSESMGAFACSGVVARTLKTGECSYFVPGGGERVGASTQDHEMSFAMPFDKAEGVIKGMAEGTEANFTTYPIKAPMGLRDGPQLPPAYSVLREHLIASDRS